MNINDQLTENAQPSVEEMSLPERSTVQLVRAGAYHYGILADAIAAIVPWREPAPLPHAPQTVLGIVSIQGRMLTVLDLKSLPIGDGVSRPPVVETPTQLVALRGDEQLAIAVERVGSTIEFESSTLEGAAGSESPLVRLVLEHEGLDINILNLQELFSSCMQGRERRRRRF